MRRWLIGFSILFPLLVVGAAGYLGFRSSQGAAALPTPTPVTVAVGQGDVQQTITAPGQVVGTREMALSMPVRGRLAEINVRAGSVVQAGDVLARLDAGPFAEALLAAQIRLAQAEAEHGRALAEAELVAQNSQARVNSARAQFPAITAAEVWLQAAIEAEQRAQAEYEKALDRHWEPPEVAEGYRLALAQATAQRQIAQAEYDAVLSRQWGVGQEVAALQADTERAGLATAYLEEQGVDQLLRLAVTQAEAALAATVLTAPFDGVIIDVPAQPGETAEPGQVVMVLADPGAAEVRVTVIEEDLPLAQIGQTAELYFDARPDVVMSGRVSRIVPQRMPGEVRPLYHVFIAPEGPLPQGVYAGMTADASITVNERTGVLRLPRALVRAGSDGTAKVQVWANGQATARAVQVGLRGDVYAEIVTGLRAGELVVAE